MPARALARRLLRELSLALLLVAAMAARPACAQTADPTTQRLLALESLGRAHPRSAAQQLEQLRATTAEFNPQRLELLTVQGLMLATSTRSDAAERAAAQLEAWAGTPGAALAAQADAAARLARGRTMEHSGDLPSAQALLQGAMAKLPAPLPARDR